MTDTPTGLMKSVMGVCVCMCAVGWRGAVTHTVIKVTYDTQPAIKP